MAGDSIIVRGARQHNLKGITVEIPHRALTVITGPSGSGKSSLAFDTLYAEGQRRYIESLSTYAKQFLERMPKPAADSLDGLAPAVAIEQKNPTTSSRSTVGTATEIYDYLRLLWSRIGKPLCHLCGKPVEVDSPTSAADKLLNEFEGRAALICFPLPKSAHSTHELILENLRAMGFVRIALDSEIFRLDEVTPDFELDHREVSVAVDRVRLEPKSRTRLADSLATAFAEGEGRADVIIDGGGTVQFSQHPRCVACETPSLPLSPTLFSFNSPRGACPGCNGFGAVLEYDESLIVPDPDLSLAAGALDPWTKPRYTRRRRMLREVARDRGIPFDRPWRRLKKTDRRFLMYGKVGRFQGMIPFLKRLERKRYKQYIRVFLRQYQKAHPCPACHGARLRPEALAVQVAGTPLADVTRLPAEALRAWLESLELTQFERGVAETVLRELTERVGFLCDVGLGYLTLDRQTRTLSGGEAQRIALANALGSRLVDTLYVLDEPSIGLHPRDIHRLVNLLRVLRSSGNTVVIVEHDPATIRAADHMIELGPGSGEHGGELVYAGSVDGALGATLTGRYLSGAESIPVPSSRRHAGPRWLTVKGARLHNLRGIDVAIPLRTLTAVTGVSGSGKSTLVHDVLFRQLAQRIRGAHGAKEHLGERVGEVADLTGWEGIDDTVLIDQSPIGRTPRSNPITYVRAFDEIRALFATQPLARARGYTPTTFSFNAPHGGRCRQCEGAGYVRVEMVFLADVFLPCEACGGTRYEPEVLDVSIRGLSIDDVLNLTVDQAIARFRHQERLGKSLWHLQQVGLGYLRLGQPATTLSGGEAQRLKIARQLATVGRKKGARLYILDEPTTGLHLDDVRVLIKVLDRLVDAGHTVVVIEHHLDIIKRADWVIDLGPEGGNAGGRVVAAGEPEEVARSGSHTARYLSQVLEKPEKHNSLSASGSEPS
ncbi:MAG: excinuclease ABC subunit UvrA [Gemmatimonadales bacterium]